MLFGLQGHNGRRYFRVGNGKYSEFLMGYKLGILSNAFPQKHTKGRAQIPYLYYSVKQ